MKIKKRAKKFVPVVLNTLLTKSIFECKYTEMPKSYQKQPYNLQAKINDRGGISVTVIFNKANNIVTILKNGH